MVKTQEWLDKKYLNKQTAETISFTDFLKYKIDQTDELIISDYSNLKEIKNYEKIYKVNRVIIKNCPQLRKVKIANFRDNQELVCDDLPNLTELDCSENQLTNLKIINCPRLQKLNCSYNELASLDLSNCYNLTSLKCCVNQLKETSFLTNLINPKELVHLDMGDNSIDKQDLSFLEKFVNLKNLYIWSLKIGNIKGGQYNHFNGSLEPLKNLTKLEKLAIDNTDIDNGLECLPDSIKELYCSTNQRQESRVKIIAEELKRYGEPASVSFYDEYEELYIYDDELGAKRSNFAELLPIWKTENNKEKVVKLQNRIEQEIKEKEELKKQQSLFTEQEKEINYLEIRVQELTSLVRKQKEKIINAFLQLFSEKDLLQELIKIHLEYTRFKEQETKSADYSKKCDEYIEKCLEIKKQLRNKLSEETEEKIMNKIQIILKDCENLVKDEIEMEDRVKDKIMRIEEHKQNPILQITDSKEEKQLVLAKRKIIELEETTNQEQLRQLEEEKQKSLQLQIELVRKESKLQVYREFTSILENQSKSLINQLVIKLKERKTLTSDKQEEVINKTKDLLGAKKIFLNTRQITIKGLQSCYNKLKGNKKYTQVDEASKVVSAMGGVASSLTFGLPKALGDTVGAINNSFKRKFSDKQTDKFKEFLVNDEKNLSLLNGCVANEICRTLIDMDVLEGKLESWETKLSNNKYKIYGDNRIDYSIWEGKTFSTAEEMEKVIILLDENLGTLKIELDQEESKFKEFVSELQTNIEILPKNSQI